MVKSNIKLEISLTPQQLTDAVLDYLRLHQSPEAQRASETVIRHNMKLQYVHELKSNDKRPESLYDFTFSAQEG